MQLTQESISDLFFSKRKTIIEVSGLTGLSIYNVTKLFRLFIKNKISETEQKNITQAEMKDKLLEDVLEAKRNTHRHIITVGDVFSNGDRMFNRNTYKEILNEEY